MHLRHAPSFFILALLATPAQMYAQSTAFTYNGRLNDGGIPVNGNYEITFSIYDSDHDGLLVAGPKPDPAEAVSIVNGLFTARVDFGDGVFTGPARWMELHVRKVGDADFTTVMPRQELTSSPYAIRAQSAGTAGDVSNGSVVKSLNALKDDVTLAPGDNVTITPNGNTLTIASAGVGGSGIWSVSGNNTYYTAGNVGIGTTTPQLPLQISRVGPYGRPAAGVADGSNGSNAWLYLLADNSFHDSLIWDAGRDLRFGAETSLGSGYVEQMRITSTGNVGIGTATPAAPLTIHNKPHTGWGFEQENGTVRFSTFLAGGSAMLGTRTAHPLYFLMNELTEMAIDTNGYVGIGTTSPTAALDVRGRVAFETGADPILYTGTGSTELNRYLELVNSDGYRSASGLKAGGVLIADDYTFAGGSPHKNDLIVKGNVAIGTLPLPSLSLRVAGDESLSGEMYCGSLFVTGNGSVCSLTIRGGCDLAEPFPTTEQNIEKGSVMVIDPDHPGQLKLSTHAYDSRVAGVISGGNGLNPGISLHQEGIMDAGENVALSGRVYVNTDASYGAIAPGDLLTTSDTPGYAMKVTDHAKAQGAILGKAMSSLSEGKGMVLVLVTLQ